MGSSLYRELIEEELKRIVAESLQTEITSARLLTGGLFNTTYLVETPKFGRVVLRVGPVNCHLLMPFEHHLMEAEKRVYDLCATQGVPVSEILAADTSKTVIDRDFMFVRHIPSRPMSECDLNAEDRARISREIGIATAKMHAISAGKFGRIVDVARGEGFERWSDSLIHELTEWERVGVPAAIFSPEEHAKTHELFCRARPYLDAVAQPRLVHADLWPGNILIRTDGDAPGFAAIIDADRAIWGDPEFEFSSIRWTHSEPCFWEGYGQPLPQTRDSRIRQGVYTLLNRLWNTYVYLLEYNQPDKAAAEQAQARAQIAELEELLGD